ncbi:MAG: aminotransferase class I/II-fold pyridoxal phosphate-dependent enzyme, partial [Gammaproteobacteria bacterium]
RTRSRLVTELNALGLVTQPSHANFVLATIPAKPGARALYESLKACHILVRYFDQDRLRDKLRISIGTDGETDQLLQQLRELLA